MSNLSPSVSESPNPAKPKSLLTPLQQQMAVDMVLIHGVRSSSQVYRSDSMTGLSWTCRIEFNNRRTGHLFSVPTPVDYTKNDEVYAKFVAKVEAFKAAVDAALQAVSND
jgi:hypothetical protein